MPLPTKTLTQRATVEHYIGPTGKSGPQFLPEILGVKCSLNPNRKTIVRGPNTTQLQAKATADFRPEDRMPELSRITIDGIRYEVLEVQPIMGPRRLIGYRAVLG